MIYLLPIFNYQNNFIYIIIYQLRRFAARLFRLKAACGIYPLLYAKQIDDSGKPQLLSTMVWTKSGGNRAVNPEFIIRGVIFHPIRVKS